MADHHHHPHDHHHHEHQEFKVRIDRTDYEIREPITTGKALLEKAEKLPPDHFQIFQKLPGGDLVEIGLHQEVDLRHPHYDRFVTLPLDQTEGEATPGPVAAGVTVPPRRDFLLPAGDRGFLDRMGWRWETVRESAVARVVIYGYPVPFGYGVSEVTLNVRIEPTYPDTQIDMVYFHPPLARVDGKPIPAIAVDRFDGADWQRWSRHRTATNGWRAGIDDLSTHLALVNHWLSREIAKAA